MSSAGAALTVLLVVAGALMFWGYSFANGNVHDQLARQNITFPPKGSEALAPAEIGKYLNKYAGQKLTTGEQAHAYAEHFIGAHLKDVAGGKTYSETSTLARANPDDAELQGQVQTLFRGETLRGLLNQAYAFWKIGQLALLGSIASWALAAVFAALTVLGFWHTRRVSVDEELLAPDVAPAPKARRSRPAARSNGRRPAAARSRK
jgi:hypothetical protein